jgi:hypothetical protein
MPLSSPTARRSWSIFYLIERGGVTLGEAALRVSGLEIGGLVRFTQPTWTYPDISDTSVLSLTPLNSFTFYLNP